MKKLTVKWSPELEQDLEAITTKGSIVYDKDLTKQLIDKYGSIKNFKKSNKFKEMKEGFNKKVKN